MLGTVALRIFISLQNIATRSDDEQGQTLAEYGLLISLIGVAAVITAIFVFKDALVGAFNAAANCLNGSC